MLNSLIRQSLNHRLMVLFLAVALVSWGTYTALELPIDVFPDLDRPRVVILAECPGLATSEVETLVTQPMEIALLGAGGVEAVRSQSTAGLAVVFIEFNWNTKVQAARQTVQERLATLTGVLPDGIRPQMAPTSSIMGQIVIAGVYRQAGPGGGALAPLGNSGLVVEQLGANESAAKSASETAGSENRIAVGKPGQPGFAVWRVTNRRRPQDWVSVAASELTWSTAPEPISQSSGANSGAQQPPLAVTVGGQEYPVIFAAEVTQAMSLRSIADWIIRPRLLRIPGVAAVFVQGSDRKQFQILVDPTALTEYGVTLGQVEQSLRESNINTSGGFAIQGESERPIRVLGRIGPGSEAVLSDLSQVPIKSNAKRTVLLGQVAQIVEGPQPKRGDGSVNGQPGVVFTIAKQPHTDTRGLTEKINLAFDELEAGLPADLVVNANLFQLKNFIDRGVYNVAEALAVGSVLIVVVLLLFLQNWRTTIITLAAIPVSLVITTIVFRFMEMLTGTPVSINVMTLGGIAVALGELVDDAIVDVENIFRRLSENARLAVPQPPIRVIYEASCEIRGAIVFGTAVVVLVFIPLFALDGVEGRLFVPLGVAYIVSILASLAVSLTLTPVLAFYLLPQTTTRNEVHHDGWLLRMLKHVATYLIRTSLHFPKLLLAITWIGVAAAAWQFVHLGQNFLPQFDEGSVQINFTLPPGSSLEASKRVAGEIDLFLKSIQKTATNPEGVLLYFVSRIGRAELDEHAAPVNVGEYILGIDPARHRSRDELIDELGSEIRRVVPGVEIEIEQPLAHMISHMVSGVYAQIAFTIYGDDLDQLLGLARRVKATVGKIDGVTPPVIEPIQQTDELHIRLRPDDLALYGLTRQYVGFVVQTALQGAVVSQVIDGQRRFDLLVRLEEAYRTDYANLGRLRIDLPSGTGQVELRELADIGEGTGPNSVNRENARRRIVVRCNSRGRDLASLVGEIEREVRGTIPLPVGYFWELGGQFENQKRATARLSLLVCVAFFGMLVVLLMLYPSTRICLQILNALPTAFIGGVFGLVLTGQTLTVASLVGFISLGGIAVRNGILLVTHYFHLMQVEGEEFSEAMILRGSLERLAPVLMTALTAGLGLLPLVLGGHEPGREILYPVATVILGGLVTSTFCEFLIHPGLFWKFSGVDAVRLAKSGPGADHL